MRTSSPGSSLLSAAMLLAVAVGACGVAPVEDAAKSGELNGGSCQSIPVGIRCDGPCELYCAVGSTCAALRPPAWNDPPGAGYRMCRANAEVNDERTRGTQGHRCLAAGEGPVFCYGELSCVSNLCDRRLAVHVDAIESSLLGIVVAVSDDHYGPAITASLTLEAAFDSTQPSYMDVPPVIASDELIATSSGRSVASFSGPIAAGRYYIRVTSGDLEGSTAHFDYAGDSDPNPMKSVVLK